MGFKPTSCTGISDAVSFYGQLVCGAAKLASDEAAITSATFFPVTTGNPAASFQYAYSATYPNGCGSQGDNMLVTGCDLVGFKVNNGPTCAQYKYTPYVNTTTDVTHTGGVWEFENIWARYTKNTSNGYTWVN